MSKIQPKPILPKETPAPAKKPAASGAPPFTPAPPKPPKPRQAAPAAPAQPRQQPARTVRQARAQAGPGERAAERPSTPLQGRLREMPAPDFPADQQAGNRFDGANGRLPAPFFAEFAATQDQMDAFGAGPSLKETMQAAALDEALDSAALARLLPAGGNDGIFDVVLPTGERLGVVVSGQPSALTYLLSPATEKFGSRLRRQRMELEERMERLTHRNVNITVL